MARNSFFLNKTKKTKKVINIKYMDHLILFMNENIYKKKLKPTQKNKNKFVFFYYYP
jgi:hypothetical protein